MAHTDRGAGGLMLLSHDAEDEHVNRVLWSASTYTLSHPDLTPFWVPQKERGGGQGGGGGAGGEGFC